MKKKWFNKFGLYTKSQMMAEIDSACELAAKIVTKEWYTLKYWGVESLKDTFVQKYLERKKK